MKIALSFLALTLLLTACSSADVVITAAPPPTITATAPASPPSPITVYVDGATVHTGKCTLPFGSLVKDALQAAGGPESDADLERLNLALALQDGQYVHVPAQGEVLPTATPVGVTWGGLIDINQADAELLQTLPNIGPATAQNIIEYRESKGPFEHTGEIMEVKGIGEKTFEKIQSLITVELS